MAEPNWWEADPVVGSPAPAAPTAPSYPGVIPGRPKPVDPYKERDQQLQEAAAAREAERLRMAQEDQARQQAEAAGTGGKPTEAQQKTSILLSRIMNGFGTITRTSQGDRAAQEPGFVESARGGLDPKGFGGAAVRKWAGENRRIVHDAQQDALDALLTLGTGAAYNQEQLSGQMTAYFPAYGDTQREISEKNNRMKSLIAAAKVNAGPKWGEVEAAIAPYLTSLDTKVPEGATIRDGKVYDAKGAQIGISPGAPDGPALPPSGGAGGDGGFLGVDSWGELGSGLAMGVGDLVEGAGDIAGIVTNPISTTIGRAMGYDHYTADLGTSLREAIGLPDNPHKAVSAATKAGIGALTGSLAGRGLAIVASPGVVQGALARFGATPGSDMLAGAGAGAGGEVGREYGGIPGQVAGTLIGGATGFGRGNALAHAATDPRGPNALLQAADDLNIQMMPADVGGVGTRMATGAFGRTLGGIPIAEGAQRAIGSAAKAREKIASDIGRATDNIGAGQAAKRGFDQFTKSSEKRAGELYEAVSVPAESSVQLGQTRGALAEVTRGMQSNPELSRLWANHPRLRATLEALTPEDVAPQGRQAFTEASERLERLLRTKEAEIGSVPGPHRTANLDEQIAAARNDVAAARETANTPPQGGELSWGDMKRFRSIVGEIIGQPGIQRDGSDIAALRKLYGALTSDMEVTAAQAGPKALQEFRRANQFWRGREARIDEVFSALLGKDGNRSDEAVFKQINSWAKGDNGDFSRIARTVRSMPEDEANTVRSTLIQRMGMAKSANQDASGEVFSPALFSTEWRGMSPRAKNVLFPDKQHRDDLEKLALITDGMKKADQFQNFSNTALAGNATAGVAGAAVAPITTALVAAVQFGAGKLLASPRFARIVASSSKLPPRSAAKVVSEQLTALARREPLIANDVRAVQDHLARSLGQSPGRAAAEEESDTRRVPPQQ